jgi:hypothetical protein
VVSGTPNLVATRIVGGFHSPLDLQAAPGDRTRLFVVEQPFGNPNGGEIYRIDPAGS